MEYDKKKSNGRRQKEIKMEDDKNNFKVFMYVCIACNEPTLWLTHVSIQDFYMHLGLIRPTKTNENYIDFLMIFNQSAYF